jgi:hypothetical protein
MPQVYITVIPLVIVPGQTNMTELGDYPAVYDCMLSGSCGEERG